MPAERRPSLIQRTIEFIKPTHLLDDPADRKNLALRMCIELKGSLPECVMNGPCVVLSNYIGSEGDENNKPYLEPTIRAFVYFSYLASLNSKKNRVIGVGRPNTKDGIPDQVLAEAVSPFLVLTKKSGGNYHLEKRGFVRIRRRLKKNGVFCATPAATTKDRGYRFDLQSGIVRIAMKEYPLAVLAIKTSDQVGHELTPVAVSSEQISLPEITYQGDKEKEREHFREAYYAITLYAMARSASLVPAGQRGEFEDPKRVMERAKSILRGLQYHGLNATGGFLDQI